MEKKEFPKKWIEPKLRPAPKPKAGEPKAASKPNWISNKVFDIIKLLLGICLLPFVYSCSVAFLNQIANLAEEIRKKIKKVWLPGFGF